MDANRGRDDAAAIACVDQGIDPVAHIIFKAFHHGADRCIGRIGEEQKEQKRGHMAALLLFLLFPNTAEASIGTMMKSLKNDMGDWIDALIYACYGGGIVSTAIGVNNGIKKTKGDPQVTTGSIFGYGLGGPALGMIGYIMSSASESIGGGASHMGKLPGGL